MKSREDYIRILREDPVRIAHLVGFPLLGDLHNDWLREMLYGPGDMTLLAHRLSYKTTTVSVALSILLAFHPSATVLFLRKTDTDVREIVAQVKKILQNTDFQYIAERVMGHRVELNKVSSTELNTTLNRSPRGTSQLLGMGIGGSLTGKHYDFIFTDDIVNRQDRISKAAREETKSVYQELQNIKNAGGRIINTGTPWHPQDAISTLMPNVQIWDCYHTGIMSDAAIEEKRRSMSPSLFAANYELRHIAAEDALFQTPPRFATAEMAREILGKDAAPEDLLRDGVAHLDAAYGGEDYTAFTCGRRRGDTIFLYGRMWHGHVDTVLDTCIAEARRMMCGPISCETNGDKGFLAKEIRAHGFRSAGYAEWENKYIKISTYLRKWWENIVFLPGTDKTFLDQITGYTEDAEHDDAPDSAACICRYYDRRKG